MRGYIFRIFFCPLIRRQEYLLLVVPRHVVSWLRERRRAVCVLGPVARLAEQLKRKLVSC